MPTNPIKHPSILRLYPLWLMILLLIANSVAAAESDLPASEYPLLNEGSAYEIHTDSDGTLWVSENLANEIWHVDPDSGDFTRYQGVNSPSDATPDGQGGVVWGDSDQGRYFLGYLNIASNQISYWEIEGADSLYGIGIDSQGRAWATDFLNPGLYRIDVSKNELCTYTIPDGGTSEYLLIDGNKIWLGDWINERILHLDAATSTFTYWQIPSPLAIRPVGLTQDDHGNLWWADQDQYSLGRLNPQTDMWTNYLIPSGSGYSPVMLLYYRGVIWYTEDGENSIGRLDPREATGINLEVERTNLTTTPLCRDLGPTISFRPQIITGNFSASSTNYASLVDADDWLIYALPANTNPSGITELDGEAWVVSSGRQQLIRFVLPLPSQKLYLPLAANGE